MLNLSFVDPDPISDMAHPPYLAGGIVVNLHVEKARGSPTLVVE
jgi:hypothetical protein